MNHSVYEVSKLANKKEKANKSVISLHNRDNAAESSNITSHVCRIMFDSCDNISNISSLFETIKRRSSLTKKPSVTKKLSICNDHNVKTLQNAINEPKINDNSLHTSPTDSLSLNRAINKPFFSHIPSSGYVRKIETSSALLKDTQTLNELSSSRITEKKRFSLPGILRKCMLLDTASTPKVSLSQPDPNTLATLTAAATFRGIGNRNSSILTLKGKTYPNKCINIKKLSINDSSTEVLPSVITNTVNSALNTCTRDLPVFKKMINDRNTTAFNSLSHTGQDNLCSSPKNHLVVGSQDKLKIACRYNETYDQGPGESENLMRNNDILANTSLSCFKDEQESSINKTPLRKDDTNYAVPAKSPSSNRLVRESLSYHTSPQLKSIFKTKSLRRRSVINSSIITRMRSSGNNNFSSAVTGCSMASLAAIPEKAHSSSKDFDSSNNNTNQPNERSSTNGYDYHKRSNYRKNLLERFSRRFSLLRRSSIPGDASTDVNEQAMLSSTLLSSNSLDFNALARRTQKIMRKRKKLINKLKKLQTNPCPPTTVLKSQQATTQKNNKTKKAKINSSFSLLVRAINNEDKRARKERHRCLLEDLKYTNDEEKQLILEEMCYDSFASGAESDYSS